MGLDAYGKVKSPEGEVEEIAYWRKHNALHGWMESLYRKKGGTEEFNCIPVELNKTDLELHYKGFFLWCQAILLLL